MQAISGFEEADFFSSSTVPICPQKEGYEMKALKRMFAPKEVRAILGVLDEADYRFDCPAFTMIKGAIENLVLGAESAKIAANVRKGISPRQSVYSWIVNIAGDELETGRHHLHRGILNPMGLGVDLLRIFDAAGDELVQIGAVDADYAAKQKAGLRKNIENEG